MTTAVQIDCITKSDRYNPWERITHVGGPNPNGQGRWFLSQEDAIAGTERRDWRFWVAGNPDSAWVEVAVSRFGNKYLKTVADGEVPDNLLSLKQCG